MTKSLLDELVNGLSAAAADEQVKELGPSEDEHLGQKVDQRLQSTQVKFMFDLIHI